jgi:hypothetical protein
MLYLLLLYILITTVCFWAGFIFYTLFPLSANTDSPFRKPLIIYLLTGLIVLTALAQWLVLFFPLNIFSLLAVTIFLLVLYFVFKKNISARFKNVSFGFKEKNIFFYLCFGIFVFMILVINAGPTIMDDTDSYHIQMIKWAQQYGTVPGIANLHIRFGFNSSWFLSVGLLSPPFKGVNSYLVLNGLLSIWFCYYLFEKIFISFSKQLTGAAINVGIPSFFVLLFCLFVWPMIRGNAATSNYDFITTCCIAILFIETALSSSKNDTHTEWVIWPVYLFTVRIVNYPVLLLTLFGLWQFYKDQKIKSLIASCVLTLVFIVPLITRNIILSGYPFFPIYSIDLFSFDWKADKQQTIDIVNYIKYYNRVSTGNMPFEKTMQLHFPDWTKAWYHFLFIYDKILTTASLCCYLFVIFIRKKFNNKFNAYSKYFFFVMILQLVSWFFIAPDPRFVYGPLLCGIFTLLFIVFFSPVVLLSGKIINTALVLTSIGVLFYTVRKIEINNDYRNWIMPYKLPAPVLRKISIDGIEFKIPEKVLNNWNTRCYDTELPCLYELDPRLKARGKTINQGFKLEK